MPLFATQKYQQTESQDEFWDDFSLICYLSVETDGSHWNAQEYPHGKSLSQPRTPLSQPRTPKGSGLVCNKGNPPSATLRPLMASSVTHVDIISSSLRCNQFAFFVWCKDTKYIQIFQKPGECRKKKLEATTKSNQCKIIVPSLKLTVRTRKLAFPKGPSSFPTTIFQGLWLLVSGSVPCLEKNRNL